MTAGRGPLYILAAPLERVAGRYPPACEMPWPCVCDPPGAQKWVSRDALPLSPLLTRALALAAGAEHVWRLPLLEHREGVVRLRPAIHLCAAAEAARPASVSRRPAGCWLGAQLPQVIKNARTGTAESLCPLFLVRGTSPRLSSTRVRLAYPPRLRAPGAMACR